MRVVRGQIWSEEFGQHKLGRKKAVFLVWLVLMQFVCHTANMPVATFSKQRLFIHDLLFIDQFTVSADLHDNTTFIKPLKGPYWTGQLSWHYVWY